MHRRAHETDLEETRRSRSERPPVDHAVLALQRGVGNQAVLRMLRGSQAVAREPGPSRLKTEPVTDLDSGGADKGEWAAAVRGGGESLALYAELATALPATGLGDVGGTTARDIKPAPRPEP